MKQTNKKQEYYMPDSSRSDFKLTLLSTGGNSQSLGSSARQKLVSASLNKRINSNQNSIVVSKQMKNVKLILISIFFVSIVLIK